MKFNYFGPDVTEKIKQAADLHAVAKDHVPLRKSGSSYVGQCPKCGGKKFTVTPSKSIFKCFSGCEVAGVGAISFLTDAMGQDFVEAMNYLADRYQIFPEEPKPKAPKRGRKGKGSFRNYQLKESGITDKAQKWPIKQGGAEVIIDRYQAASIDRSWNVIPGDDMVLHYVDLDGNLMRFMLKNSKSKRDLKRVRWAMPELHQNRDGDPMKYQSPYGSGSQFWIPNEIIRMFQAGRMIETLFITEGEKKADAMTLIGMPTLGVMGIHNFSKDNEMPHQLERLIKKCEVKRVVFVLDSDWQDLGTIKPDRPVDNRPKTFFKAVMKFREYCYAFNRAGMNLRIFFAAGKDSALKGMDDLIVRGKYEKPKKGELHPIKADFLEALQGNSGEGQFILAHDITDASSHKIKQHWHLHSTPAFLEHYGEGLKSLLEFKLAGVVRRWNADEEEFELAQAIMPDEEYWTKQQRERNGNTYHVYNYFYQGAFNFLGNRGYAQYFYAVRKARLIHIDKMVVKEVAPFDIRRYVIDFTKELGNKKLLELIYKGSHQYLGPQQLENLPVRDLRFNASDKGTQYLYFRNVYWKITADTIEERPLSELPNYVWHDQLIDFDPKLYDKPILELNYANDQWEIAQHSERIDTVDIAKFYMRTSDFAWKKKWALVKNKDGVEVWVPKSKPEKYTNEDHQTLLSSLASKMLAAGYVLHDYLDYGVTKAIVGMDGVESEVGQSQGGTGKSLWGKKFEYLHNQFVIDGKRKNIEDDNHLYEGVDERTKSILYDDVRVNFNFDFMFSQITTGITVNPKGEKKTTLKPPKFIVLTNHALNGDGNSYERRQYHITFSDFFNGNRTVGEFFGHQLFHEWDFEQWNGFYNWIATCVQHYLRFGLKKSINKTDVERRKIRQTLGEALLDWCKSVFTTDPDDAGRKGMFLNKRVARNFLYEEFKAKYKTATRYLDELKFARKLELFAKYAGLQFNPTVNGGRLKSGSDIYINIAEEESFDAAMLRPAIKGTIDLDNWNTIHVDTEF